MLSRIVEFVMSVKVMKKIKLKSAHGRMHVWFEINNASILKVASFSARESAEKR